MPTLNEFSENFNGRKIPDELIALLEFQHKSGYGSFSDGFGLASDVKDGLKYGWSDNGDFLNCLFAFAKANGSGSIYAIWDNFETSNLNEMPVVIFGDEGGEYVIAENIKQLIQILTYDAEPMVDLNEVFFYKPAEEYEPSPNLALYVKWVKTNFNLDATNNANEIVKIAQMKFQGSFNTWKMQYLGRESL